MGQQNVKSSGSKYSVRNFIYFLLIGATPLLALGGCTTVGHPVTENIVSAQRIPAPIGLYSNVTWVTPELLAVTYQKSRKERPDQLWEIGTSGQRLGVLPLPKADTDCRFSQFYEPKRIKENVISYIRLCKLLNIFGEQHVLTWNVETRKSELLRPYVLPDSYLRTSFAPDLSRGIAGEDTGIEESLYWLNPNEAEQLDLGFSRATLPAWSPDNQQIVFFGNKALGNSPGPGWAGKPYDLWSMPAKCDTLEGGCKNHLTQIVTNIFDQTAVNWSPDSRWIVFDGDLQNRGKGLWLRDMETKEIIQIQRGAFRNPSFSSDGKQIIAIGSSPGDESVMPETTELYILDVSEIVSKE